MTSNPPPDPERRELGVQTYMRVYGEDMPLMPAGQSDFFDIMMEDLFGTVWSRPALSVPLRRLLVIGVLAQQKRFDALELQFKRQLAEGELDVTQVREVVLQLIPYVGAPSASAIWRAGENAVSQYEQVGRESNSVP